MKGKQMEKEGKDGKGYITMDEFLGSIVVKHRVPFTSE